MFYVGEIVHILLFETRESYIGTPLGNAVVDPGEFTIVHGEWA